MKRWIPPLLAAGGVTVGLLSAAGAAQAAVGKQAPAARPGTHGVASKSTGAFRAVPGITNGNLLNYSVVSAPFTANSGMQTGGTVSCPSGTVVLGGGVFISQSDLTDNVNTSSPAGTPEGPSTTAWQGFIDNSSGRTTDFTVYAECATAPVGYTIVSNSADNPAGTQTDGVLATCPAGTKVLGGGGLLTSGETPVAINSSLPVSQKVGTVTTYSWRIDANNASSSDNDAMSYAVCGKKVSGYKLVHGRAVANPAGTETFASAGCPVVNGTQTVPTGGGVYSTSLSTLTNINSTYPNPVSITGWGDFENNGAGKAATITPYAVCAL